MRHNGWWKQIKEGGRRIRNGAPDTPLINRCNES